MPDIYYSNVDFLAAKRISAITDDVSTFHGNKLYRNLGNGEFEDVTEAAGVGWAGEAGLVQCGLTMTMMVTWI